MKVKQLTVVVDYINKIYDPVLDHLFCFYPNPYKSYKIIQRRSPNMSQTVIVQFLSESYEESVAKQLDTDGLCARSWVIVET